MRVRGAGCERKNSPSDYNNTANEQKLALLSGVLGRQKSNSSKYGTVLLRKISYGTLPTSSGASHRPSPAKHLLNHTTLPVSNVSLRSFSGTRAKSGLWK